MSDMTKLALGAFFIGGLFCAIGMTAERYMTKARTDRDLAFIYACGHIDGEHKIRGLVSNIPVPHQPASLNVCAKVRATAQALGVGK